MGDEEQQERVVVPPQRRESELPDGWETWPTFYPQYVDSNRTIAQGRKVARADACMAPHVYELAEIARYFKLQFVIEGNKAYPRDNIRRAGRIKVQMKDAEGNAINPEVPSRIALCRQFGKLIPKLKSREKRIAVSKMRQEQMVKASGGVWGKKGKGKKKKRR